MRSAPPTFIPATDTRMPGNVANLSRMLKAAEGETGRTPRPFPLAALVGNLGP